MSAGVLLVGDVIDDVLVLPSGPVREDTDTPSRIERHPGGSAANTACWLAAHGTPATLVASVAAVDVDRCGAELRRHGATPRLHGTDASTGAIVVLSEGERRTMLTDRGANAETAPHLVTADLLAGHGHLHLTGHLFSGVDRDDAWRGLLDAAAAAGVRRSVAPGSAGLLAEYGADRFLRLVAGVEVLIASEDEALLLTGEPDADRAALALGHRHALVAVTRGSRGALIAADGRVMTVEPVRVPLVDATGAGDAWAAGLIAALLDGAGPAEAGARAAALAARAVQRIGARPA